MVKLTYQNLFIILQCYVLKVITLVCALHHLTWCNTSGIGILNCLLNLKVMKLEILDYLMFHLSFLCSKIVLFK